jgi:arylsulfatase
MKMQQLTSKYFSILMMLFFCCIFFSCSEPNKEDLRPNIVLIVADDLGFGDISCYGGDIATPNIDGLAYNGIRFSGFHTAPMCAPTRAMLLSGNDNHIAGVGKQGRSSEEFGYEGKLTNRIVPFPSLLKDAGYHTYMAGKWHLGKSPDADPYNKGFERSFALIQGAGNHYNNQSALGKGKSDYTENGDSTNWESGNYSTDFYTDKLIEYIDRNKDDGKPFFAYAAYTSPHWPLQVDKKNWSKFIGRYDDGYEKLREKRLEGLKKAGIIPEKTLAPPVHESVKSWNSLSEKEKLKEARKMELYAGMVDNLDFNIGRLIQYLKDIGKYENTFFVFMSDNGAAYRDFINAESYKMLREYYNDDYENMCNADSYISYGPQWAEAGSAPFRYFKDYATEGGTNTTLVISGPPVVRKNEIHHVFTSVLDLAPTFYDLAEISYPEIYQGNRVYPLRGNSLLPFLSGMRDKVHDEHYVFALEHYGNSMLRKGNWKITNYKTPFNIGNFELFDLTEDLGEQNDLKEHEPEKYEELLGEWKRFSEEIKFYGNSDAK